ncbi:single-stranded-DNA-specific exonuclease RecJ [Candidatus Campbellbacteria bacterium]|nr:single-stranded-DNA-specific exonuclease RecJ [Candidatus Campbellbacteria bacterium]
MDIYTLSEKITQNHPLLKKYSPLVAQLLLNRSITETTAAEEFIKPSYTGNHDPLLLHNCEQAIDQIYSAIIHTKKIIIYADYDADGIPGAVVLSTLFDKIGYTNYDIYIPHRHDEGYGLHIEALEKCKNDGAELIITIDLGVTAIDQADWCNDNNIELIVTDHHLPQTDPAGNEELPHALVVNPKQSACHYPEPMLCGAGVIFKIVQAFIQKYGEEFNVHVGWEKWLLDMVGLATISDMVPLTGENRIFAYFGMEVMKKTRRGGLKKMMWDAGINNRYMTTSDIGFNLTPRINAASRMSHPKDALAVLRASKTNEIERSANLLTELNNTRKKLTRSTTKKAIAMVNEKNIPKVIAVGNKDWSIGIAGLVASKLVDRFKRPVFVWTEEHGVIKGSARSYGDVHLIELMKACPSSTFESFGGHKEAAGFTCTKKYIDDLETYLSEALNSLPQEKSTQRHGIIVDAEIGKDQIIFETYKDLRKLAPFGIGNEEPIFIIKDVQLEHVGTFGKEGDHTEVVFSNTKNEPIRGICFFKQPNEFTITPKTGDTVSLVGTIEFSTFMGKNELRIKVIDITEIDKI